MSLTAFASKVNFKSNSESKAAKIQLKSGAALKNSQVLFNIQETPQDILASAMSAVQQNLTELAKSGKFSVMLGQSFGKAANAENSAWAKSAKQLQAKLSSGKYSVKLSLRTNEELHGAFGAFAKATADQLPVIYLNEDWLNQYADQKSVEKVLTEELGHSFDAYLNQDLDTQGDEGEFFAALAVAQPVNSFNAQRIALENDHDTVLIDGNLVAVEDASVYFNKVFVATKTNSKIDLGALLTGASFKFTSATPPDATFSASNGDVLGTFSYYNTSTNAFVTVNGAISFRVGQGTGFLFQERTSAGVLTGLEYLLVNPANDSAFSAGQLNINLNAANTLTELNNLLNTQSTQPIISVNDPAAVLESAGYVEFTVSLASASVGNITFTPVLSNGTATAASDYTNSMEYQNSSNVWVPVTGAVTMTSGQTSLKIRVPIIDDSEYESGSGQTFNLYTGLISGGTVINRGGAIGLATITDNDQAPTSLSYTSPNTYVKGDVVSLSPTLGAGSGVVTSYTVSPALPAGLTLNSTNGIISGTTSAVAATASYRVTASNNGGSATFDLVITVNDVAPSALSYTSPNTFTKGVSVVSLSPTVSGGAVVTYSAPSLPAGLSINSSTGVISGTPSAITATATYTVTATNTGGS
ncbi:MAG: putative Ig domain-containing protein, partial [Sphingobacteriaceae bacterium]